MRLSWASETDTGNVRDHNEDSVLPEGAGRAGPGLIVAVADGMGGHVAGEVASRTAIEAALDADDAEPEQRVHTANEAVLDRVDAEPRLAGMGTTLTLAEFTEDGVTIAHIGDSRAYLLHDGDLTQLTRDHSLVAELVEAGELRPEDVRHHPYRSVITRALGLERVIAVDTRHHDLEPGDQVLLCSDGLTEMVRDGVITDILLTTDEPAAAARALIEAGNEAGGHDNISVVIVRVDADDQD